MAVIFSDDLMVENDFTNRDFASSFPVRSMTQISPRTNGLDLIAISCFGISEVRAPPLFRLLISRYPIFHSRRIDDPRFSELDGHDPFTILKLTVNFLIGRLLSFSL
jgi:hypothetical protein